MAEYTMNLNEVLYSLRVKYRITQTELSNATGFSLQQINDWELGTSQPTVTELKILIAYFKTFETGASFSGDDVYSDASDVNETKKGRWLITKMMEYVTGDKNATPQIGFRQLLKTSVKHASFWVLLIGIALFALSAAILPDATLLLIITGSIPVPLFMVLFLYENNLYHNISFKHTVCIFLVGGGLSIVLALLAYAVFQASNYFIVALVEEFAKVLTSYFIIKKIKVKKILPALLVGAAVGAGFAMIESAEYAYAAFTENGWQSMMMTIIVRAATEFGTHAVWSAISAGALVRSARLRPLEPRMLTDMSFLKVFCLPVILHLLWNTLSSYNWVLIIIGVCGFCLMVAMLNIGLKEYNSEKRSFYFDI